MRASASFTRVFLSKVSPAITELDLRGYFASFGTLKDSWIPSGGSKGIAFLTYEQPEHAMAVVVQKKHYVKPEHEPLIAGEATERPGGIKGGKGAKGGEKGLGKGADGVGKGGASGTLAELAKGFLQRTRPRSPPKKPSASSSSSSSSSSKSSRSRNGKRIFLSKVTSSISDSDLMRHFSKFGAVSDAWIPAGGSKGVAFVTFEKREAAKAAIVHKRHNVRSGHEALYAGEATERPSGKGVGGKGIVEDTSCDWHCPRCGNRNFARRPVCFKCQELRPIPGARSSSESSSRSRSGSSSDSHSSSESRRKAARRRGPRRSRSPLQVVAPPPGMPGASPWPPPPPEPQPGSLAGAAAQAATLAASRLLVARATSQPEETAEIVAAKAGALDALKQIKADESKDRRQKAFKKLQLEWHPDKNKGRIEVATVIFQLLQEAKELLDL